ncbi:hypothetical protein NP233_g982 [Leucocoprinus birnbaumii]|uniref:ATP-dependent DNA helicase n=1 Tax=Leucocoprinus birnbaumii TaxID=56174 RepID=A0AAD5YWA0_9AGAR|nr:hypothetical protein NP233_g982 [Leucocoprinus birnbaumii]
MDLWSFTATVDKVKRTQKEIHDDTADNDLSGDHENLSITAGDGMRFLPSHPDHRTHQLRQRKREQYLVPVITGGALPKKCCPIAPRFARCMLMLFKPWRSVEDLLIESNWVSSFEGFLSVASSGTTERINNIEQLQNCKDIGIEEAVSRRKSGRTYQGNDLRGLDIDRDSNVNSSIMTENQRALLDELFAIEDSKSKRIEAVDEQVNECVDHLNRADYFTYGTQDNTALEQSETGFSQEVPRSERNSLESIWRKIYESRRAATRQNLRSPAQMEAHLAAIPDRTVCETVNIPEIQRVPEESVPTQTTTVSNHSEVTDTRLSLNLKQRRAFNIVRDHALNARGTRQFLLYIGGAAGTGKTRVIEAIMDFFYSRNELQRLRLGAYTGVAAKNIGGLTLHCLLALSQRDEKRGYSSSVLNDLSQAWNSVEYFVIDEISMVSCKDLYNVSRSLRDIKGCNKPFGGINMIFCGDFAQLPPINQTRLYSNIDVSQLSSSMTIAGQKTLKGRLLWLSLTHVVLLTESVRQNTETDAPFVGLLNRLRTGTCNTSDFAILTSRVIENNFIDWIHWLDAPIIVAENAQKDAINVAATQAFANRTRQSVYDFYATDSLNGSEIDDPELQQYLLTLPSNVTEARVGKLALVKGMKVMVLQNYDVEHGIVNGVMGTLDSVRYTVGINDRKHATSCVVTCNSVDGEPLPGLHANQLAVLEDTVRMSFKRANDNHSITITRRQLPLVPAYALTNHKSQGQTLDKAIVDLEGTHGSEPPYVMATRVRHLDDLLILRPFKINRITCHMSKAIRTEERRLRILDLKTVLDVGDEAERVAAAQALESMR